MKCAFCLLLFIIVIVFVLAGITNARICALTLLIQYDIIPEIGLARLVALQHNDSSAVKKIEELHHINFTCDLMTMLMTLVAGLLLTVYVGTTYTSTAWTYLHRSQPCTKFKMFVHLDL